MNAMDTQIRAANVPPIAQEAAGANTATVGASASTPNAPPIIRQTWGKTGSPISKIQTASGKWPLTPGARAPAFTFETKEYPDLTAYARAYLKRQQSQRPGYTGCGYALVPGVLDPSLDEKKQHPRNSSTIVDAKRALFTIDFDGLEPDPGGCLLDTAVAFAKEVLSVVLSRLPKAFRAAAKILLATASTALPENSKGEPAAGRAWFRLVFHLSRPLTCAEQMLVAKALKNLPGLGCIDLAIYSPPQWELVARPEFLRGWRSDPIKDPVILHDGPPLDVDALLAELGLDLDPAASPQAQRSAARAKSWRDRVLDVALERRIPLVRQAVAAIVNNLERRDWIYILHAIEGALGDDPEAEYIFYGFSSRRVDGTSDPDEDERVWSSRGEGKAGYGYLMELLNKQGTPDAEAAILAIRQAQAKAVFSPLTDEEVEAAAKSAAIGLDPPWLREMNKHYAIIQDRPDAVFDLRGTARGLVKPLKVAAFHLLYANQMIQIPAAKGATKLAPQSKLWLVHPRRREYTTADDYPAGMEPPGALNLWKGLAVEPKAGKWPVIEEFLRDVICAGSQPDYAWLLNLLRWKIQNPTENPEVAISLQGAQGVGKGTFGIFLQTIFGLKRFRLFGRPDDMANRFNAAAEGKLVLFYDEAVFAHDPKIGGRLKSEITEHWLTIELKGIDSYEVRNRALRIFASNDAAPIAIDLDDRRVFVLEAANIHAKDEAYFKALHQAFDGDELAAFVDDALKADLSVFETARRNPPKTKAKAALAAATAKPEHEFLRELLDKGGAPAPTLFWEPRRYPRVNPEPKDPWRTGRVTVERDAMHRAYLEWMKVNNPHARHSVNAAELDHTIQQVLGVALFHSGPVREKGKLRRMAVIGKLKECRDAYDKHAGCDHEWS
jgi:Family of unknown function (DUF5906)